MALASIDEWAIGFAKIRRIASNLKLRWVQINLRLLLLSVIANPIMGRLVTMLAIENPTTHRIATQRLLSDRCEVAAIARFPMQRERSA